MGWKHVTRFRDLVAEMMTADLAAAAGPAIDGRR